MTAQALPMYLCGTCRSLMRKDEEADRGADFLTRKLRAREPFFFVRYGDGALECMAGRVGRTRDMERYSEMLGQELAACWRLLMKRPDLTIVGDWQTASFDNVSAYSRYSEQYEKLFGETRPERIHFESLLLMRWSKALIEFYRTVRDDPRPKLFMGPEWNSGAAKMLDAQFLSIPTQDLFRHQAWLLDQLRRSKFEVLLYGAGMAGNVPAVKHWDGNPELTYVNLGSAMDPLFYRQTRNQQIPMAAARDLFKELLA